MPIAVLCPGCNSRLNAPDAAAGKTVKCPKCQTPMVLPAPEPAASDFEVVDEPAAPKKPAPKSATAKKPAARTDVQVDDDDEDDRPRKKKPVVEADDDEEDDRPRGKKRSARDDDDEEDDRPRKKKKAAKKGTPVGLLVGGGLALLLLLGGCGFAIYWFAIRDKAAEVVGGTGTGGGASTKGTIPAGWQVLSPTGAGFKTVVPLLPKDSARWTAPPPAPTPPVETEYRCPTADGKTLYVVSVYTFPEAMSAADRMAHIVNDLKKEQQFPKQFIKETTRKMTLGGVEANELLLEIDIAGLLSSKGAGIPKGAMKGEKPPDKLTAVARYCVNSNKGYVAGVVSLSGSRAPEADEKAFFDNFEFTK